MVDIGRYNTLSVIKLVEFGVYLEGGELGNILLPKRYVPENTAIGDQLEVFVYLDSEDEVIATTEKPLAQVGEFAAMKVAGTSRIGAFVDWGLKKDLLIPFAEQRGKMVEGRSYVVRVYTDKASGRLVGSTKLNKFLDQWPPCYKTGDAVDALIYEETELGFKAVVENSHNGLIFKSESFGRLPIGKTLRVYIKRVREDGKLDLSQQKPGMAKVDDIQARILKQLARAGGSLPVGDKSAPEVIFAHFKTSKGTFKKAIGGLYKQGLITMDKQSISLTVQEQNQEQEK